MNKILGTLGLLLLSAVTFASPISNLRISGNITPPTCTVNGVTETDVIYDFGRISLGLIPESAAYLLKSPGEGEVRIECDAETYLTFRSADAYGHVPLGASLNSKGSAWSRLVDAQNPDRAVGELFYLWDTDKVYVDGVRRYINRDDSALTGTSYNNALYNGPLYAFTSSVNSNISLSRMELISGRTFQVVFKHNNSASTQSYIFSKTDLANNGVDLSEGFDFIGKTVVTFNFGI